MAACNKEPVETKVTIECPPLTDAQIAEVERLQTEGTAAYQQSSTAEAIVSLEAAVAINPCDASVHNDLGIAYHQNNEIKRAIETLQRSIETDPLAPAAHLNLGSVYDDFANFTEAAKEYEEFIRLRPDFADAHTRLGLVYLKLNRFEEAQKILETAGSLKPSDWEIWFNLGSIAFTAKDYETAEKQYRKTLEKNKNYTEAHYKLGQTLQRLDRADEAQYHFDEFKALSEHQEKIDELNRILRQQTERADAVHMLLGVQYTEIARYDDAIENFERSLSINDENPETYIGMVNTYRLMKEYDKALEVAAKVKKMEPNRIEVFEAIMSVYNDSKQPDKAIALAKEIVTLNPDYKHALLNLGILERQAGHYAEAVKVLQEYVAVEPERVIAHEVLLSIYTSATDSSFLDSEMALHHAKMAESLGSQRHELVAEAYHHNGDLDTAKIWLKRALLEAEGDAARRLEEHLAQVESEQKSK